MRSSSSSRAGQLPFETEKANDTRLAKMAGLDGWKDRRRRDKEHAARR
jgi:hypothetical protein